MSYIQARMHDDMPSQNKFDDDDDNAHLARVRVGCQGWNYDDWVTPPAAGRASVFYPTATRPAAMLEAYARMFETVEIDSTFYAIPSASTIEGWRKRTPDKFTFSLKLPQEITHERALRGEGTARVLEEFCARVRFLGEKLAVVLVQFPPQFIPTTENVRALREFLPLLPREMRFALEFRDPAWFEESALEIFARLKHVTPALVEGQWMSRERVWRAAEIIAAMETADFAYVRWMGARNIETFDRVLRAQDENLEEWATHIARVSERVPNVYAYFSNFYEGHAPASANKLKRLLGQRIVEPSELEDQPSLF